MSTPVSKDANDSLVKDASNSLVKDDVIGLVAANFKLGVVTSAALVSLSKDHEDIVYRLDTAKRTLAVRVKAVDISQGDMAEEQVAVSVLSQHQLFSGEVPVPIPVNTKARQLYLRADSPDTALVLTVSEWVEGAPLADVFHQLTPRAELHPSLQRGIRALATTAARAHAVTATPLDPRVNTRKRVALPTAADWQALNRAGENKRMWWSQPIGNTLGAIETATQSINKRSLDQPVTTVISGLDFDPERVILDAMGRAVLIQPTSTAPQQTIYEAVAGILEQLDAAQLEGVWPTYVEQPFRQEVRAHFVDSYLSALRSLEREHLADEVRSRAVGSTLSALHSLLTESLEPNAKVDADKAVQLLQTFEAYAIGQSVGDVSLAP